MIYQDGETGKSFAKKFQIGGLSREKLYSLVKSENSRVIYLHISATEKGMPKTLHVSLDGRSGARIRELDIEMRDVPVSTRTAKGITVTKWTIKDVKEGK
jgi:topoisomerase-4 subunit A